MTLKIEKRHLRKMCINSELFGVLRYFLYILAYLPHCITLINKNKIILNAQKNKNISNVYVASTDLCFYSSIFTEAINSWRRKKQLSPGRPNPKLIGTGKSIK